MHAFQQFPSPVLLPSAPFVSIQALSKGIAEAICKPRLVAPFASKLVVVRTGTSRFKLPIMISQEERRVLEQLIAAAGLRVDPISDTATWKRLLKLYRGTSGRPPWLPIPMSESSLRYVFAAAELEASRLRAAHEEALGTWVIDGRLEARDARTLAPTKSVDLFTQVSTEDLPKYLIHAHLPFDGVKLTATAGSTTHPPRIVPQTDEQAVRAAHSKHDRWTETDKKALCELKDCMTWPELSELYGIWPSRLQKVRREYLASSLDRLVRGAVPRATTSGRTKSQR